MNEYKINDLTEAKEEIEEIIEVEAEAVDNAEQVSENADNEVIDEDIAEKAEEIEEPEEPEETEEIEEPEDIKPSEEIDEPEKTEQPEKIERPEVKGIFFDSAAVFGESEESLRSEFKNFKATRLFSKMNLMLNDSSMYDKEVKGKLSYAASLGFGSVSVLQTRLNSVLKEVNGRFPVYALVSFPFAADDFKTRLFCVKRVKKTDAAGVEIPVNIAELSENKYKQSVKELKKIKKCLGDKKELIIIAEIGKISPNDISTLAKICKDAGIKNVKTSCGIYKTEQDVELLNNLKSELGENINVIACADTERSEEVVSALASGAKIFSSPNAINLAMDIKTRMGE